MVIYGESVASNWSPDESKWINIGEWPVYILVQAMSTPLAIELQLRRRVSLEWLPLSAHLVLLQNVCNVCTACYNFHILHVFCYVLFSKFNARPVPWHVDSDDSHISAAMDGSLDVRGVGGFLLSDRRCLCDLTQHVSTWSCKDADCLGVSALNQ